VTESIYQEALDCYQETIALRRWFHAHPEPSFKEYLTAKKIREELAALGIEYAEAGETGTVGVIRGNVPSPVVALRADIDALEITEETGAEYRSLYPGIMHACGHDAHTAALLTAAKLLIRRKSQLNGTVKLIFQPAEEIGRGAESLIAAGLLNDVNAFFGIHVRAGLPVGTVCIQAGPVMAGANTVFIDVHGKSGHGGHPDEGIDAIAAGAAIVENLQHIAAREIPPNESVVISICQFHAGTRENIIANYARLSGTVRIISDERRSMIAGAIRRVVDGVSKAHRVESQVTCEYATPILYNSTELTHTVLAAATAILPEDAVRGVELKMGTEDFGVYRQIAPAFFVFAGSGGEFSHHHEKFDVDENVLPVCAALHTAFAMKFLAGI
jgi:amidohydrolase